MLSASPQIHTPADEPVDQSVLDREAQSVGHMFRNRIAASPDRPAYMHAVVSEAGDQWVFQPPATEKNSGRVTSTYATPTRMTRGIAPGGKPSRLKKTDITDSWYGQRRSGGTTVRAYQSGPSGVAHDGCHRGKGAARQRDVRGSTPTVVFMSDNESPFLSSERAVLTKVSLVGGVSLRVPHDVDVVVEGFRIFGGVRIEPARRAGAAARTLKVREYSLVGGIHVERC